MKMASGRDNLKGLTMVEILIAMAIFLIILGITFSLLNSSLRRFAIINVLQEVQRNGIIGMDRFARDFSETTDALVVNETEGIRKCIYFPSKRNRQGIFNYNAAAALAGSSPWKSWIVYFLLPDQGKRTADNRQLYCLARKIKEMDHKPTDPEIISLISSFDGAQMAARNVVSFTVRLESSGEIDTFRAQILTECQYSGRKCTFTMDRVFLLNSM
jgi:prepilin-type N-terminal cleavage/methylation domain-containing protein